MRDISLHLMDLAQNSIAAGARLISVDLALDENGVLTMRITDDGRGMTPEAAQRALGPFATTRTTRKVGLGLPLTQANARLTGGDLTIASAPNEGTTVTCTFYTRHIDCLPLGDLAQTIAALVAAHPDGPDIELSLTSPKGESAFGTAETRDILHPVPLDTPEVIAWITQSLREQTDVLFGGER